jgi:hypothetical protein
MFGFLVVICQHGQLELQVKSVVFLESENDARAKAIAIARSGPWITFVVNAEQFSAADPGDSPFGIV